MMNWVVLDCLGLCSAPGSFAQKPKSLWRFNEDRPERSARRRAHASDLFKLEFLIIRTWFFGEPLGTVASVASAPTRVQAFSDFGGFGDFSGLSVTSVASELPPTISMTFSSSSDSSDFLAFIERLSVNRSVAIRWPSRFIRSPFAGALRTENSHFARDFPFKRIR